MNDYEHDRQAEIRFHLQYGPVILPKEDFEEAVFQIYANPARWMNGKRLGASPMCMVDPMHYPWERDTPIRLQLY